MRRTPISEEIKLINLELIHEKLTFLQIFLKFNVMLVHQFITLKVAIDGLNV